MEVISLHFGSDDDTPDAVGNISRMLYSKGFEFVRRMDHNYFYQAISPAVERKRQSSRKADQLFL